MVVVAKGEEWRCQGTRGRCCMRAAPVVSSFGQKGRTPRDAARRERRPQPRPVGGETLPGGGRAFEGLVVVGVVEVAGADPQRPAGRERKEVQELH